MAFLKEPEKLTGFKTSDRQVFENIMDARTHQNELSMMIWLENNRPSSTDADDLLGWLKLNQERFDEYFYCQEGSDPLYKDER